MRIDLKEKVILYSFGCPNLDATIHRMRMIAAMTPDPAVKKQFLTVGIKLCEEGADSWYPCFYYNLRLEIGAYLNHKRLAAEVEHRSTEVTDYDFDED